MGSALPASRFGGNPVFLHAPRDANRRSRHASHSLARPYRARRESRRRRPSYGRTRTLMGFSSPTALAEPRVRSTRALPRPPPSALSVSRALGGLLPATPLRACFIPVTLLGFRLQGFDPRREAVPLSRPVLSCRSSHDPRPRTAGPGTRLQSLAPPGESAPPRAETHGGRCPPGVLPSKALPAARVGPRLTRTALARRAGSPRPFLPCTSPTTRTPRACASEYSPLEASAFPPHGGAGLSGVSHLVRHEGYSHPRRCRRSGSARLA
jgi:hypothetical protein